MIYEQNRGLHKLGATSTNLKRTIIIIHYFIFFGLAKEVLAR